jgi:3-methyladenine DNA glycosylase/8-oxoguanine DNA glycosylase
MPKTIRLETLEHFSFKHTVYSHGWSDLLPFALDRENQTLNCVLSGADDENPVSAIVKEADDALKVEILGEKYDERKIIRDVRHILRLDDDLSDFYRLVEKEKSLAWIAERKAGRLLRSPTVFEDLVKTICTTNCSWALTRKMTTNLVEKLGKPTIDGKRAFPTAAAMASVSVDFFREEIRAGYRAAYFVELAEAVACGRINPESWLDSKLPAKELKREMKKIKGVGDYAADNLLKLVGSYEGLALDSWVRSQFYKKHNDGTVCSDDEIEHFYRKFGKWRGLIAWCDVTEKWFSDAAF